MGSNVAPAYANAYMHSFEEQFIYNNESFLQYAIEYHRYIDDIFMIWTGTPDTLSDFHGYLNSIFQELQFTLNFSATHIAFLDTMVLKDPQGRLSTDLHTKPTDCNSLLLYSSCHPRSTKDSLPRSQFKRVSRIVSDPETLHTRLDLMSEKFRDREYPSTLLHQERLLSSAPVGDQPPKIKQERLPFVHTHHPFMPKVHSAIRRHWPLLGKAYPSIPSFQTPALMSTRRPPNIKDQIVRADIGSARTELTQQLLSTRRHGTFPCLHCAACSNIIRTDSITHPRTGKSFPIRGFFTCESNFVVYLIKCPCGLLYVGETIQHVRDRVASHKSTIRCGKTWLPLPAHFAAARHTVAQLKFQVIEQVPRPRRGGDHIKLLRSREAYWIYTLDTLAPKGLNREIDWLP
ncbi:uncharacterized protein LOC143818356 [Ranitomeya variabilis]|uniref:uncharacterized protein LOC143818356 n=1 Tax=Ranitomeya variabilis TaxID=490064 RepID=UPI004055F33D